MAIKAILACNFIDVQHHERKLLELASGFLTEMETYGLDVSHINLGSVGFSYAVPDNMSVHVPGLAGVLGTLGYKKSGKYVKAFLDFPTKNGRQYVETSNLREYRNYSDDLSWAQLTEHPHKLLWKELLKNVAGGHGASNNLTKASNIKELIEWTILYARTFCVCDMHALALTGLLTKKALVDAFNSILVDYKTTLYASKGYYGEQAREEAKAKQEKSEWFKTVSPPRASRSDFKYLLKEVFYS